ncbi:hypothetical protein KC362_g27 [Hortaea werneckii]|nr:hypothetical protein KC362_g27 [Hortaea werneckii]
MLAKSQFSQQRNPMGCVSYHCRRCRRPNVLGLCEGLLKCSNHGTYLRQSSQMQAAGSCNEELLLVHLTRIRKKTCYRRPVASPKAATTDGAWPDSRILGVGPELWIQH